MANKEINDFTLKAVIDDSDEIVLQETAGGTTKKTTMSSITSQNIGGGFTSSKWLTDTAGVVAPPVDKSIRWDNATQASATELFFDYDNEDGVDVSFGLGKVLVGSRIRLQQSNDGNIYQEWEVTSATDNTTYYTYGVTLVESTGGDIASNRDTIATLINANNLPDHASNHTDGTDDIQDSTAGQKGLATAAQITKLDGIEALAEVNPTDGETKTAYEANADTNAFTDADESKLDGIEALATIDQTGAEIKTAYEAEVNAYTDTKDTKLGGIEALAEVNPTDAETKTAYENNADTNAFTDADESKLDGIEALAEVNNIVAVTSGSTSVSADVDTVVATFTITPGKVIIYGFALTDDVAFALHEGNTEDAPSTDHARIMAKKTAVANQFTLNIRHKDGGSASRNFDWSVKEM